MSIKDGLLGDKSTMARDIYLAEKLIELADLIEPRLQNLEQRLNTLERLRAGPRKDLSGPLDSVAGL